MQPNTWRLVLAAGAGRRLSSVTGGTPKQFWRPNGRTSLLEDTVERLAPIGPSSRTVTVVDRTHELHVQALPEPDRLGHVLYQPADRGTAAGVLLGLTAIAERERNPIVVMTPSDHGVERPDLFRAGLRLAGHEIEDGRAGVVLFGVEPDHPSDDYGWILPAERGGRHATARVEGFVEKPAEPRARALLAAGAVWNTMVLVASGHALLDLFRRHLPDLEAVFADARRLPPAARAAFFDRAYDSLPRYDFSHDLLTPAESLSLIVWPASIGWSDLGTPDRLHAWQAHGASPEPLLTAV